MPSRSEISRLSWTLIDQAVVSVGSFSVNIALARLLPQPDYGIFAAILASLLLLQIVNVTLVLYPATLYVASPKRDDRQDVIAAALLLLTSTTLPLACLLVAILLALGEVKLIAGVLGWFLAWQVQEAMRRFLFAEFRYRSAVLGDALSYLGQAVGVAVLAWSGALTLPAVFIVLGSTSLLGALVQCAQVGVSFRVPEDLVRRARDHWTLGSWSLAGSVVSALRFQLPFWLLALVSGRTELATLQAMLNVINVMNPVLIGICNLVPPTAARAFDGSWSSAWSATRPYVILGFVPTAAYAFFVFAAPEHVLRLLYGAESPYTGEGLAVRVLAISLVLNYVGEMVCSFLHGVGAPQMAWLMNLASLVAVFFAFIAFYPWLGWLAAILAIALGQGIRLLVSYAIVKRAGGSAYARLA